MSSKKIVIVARVIFPSISPRSFRATELAKALSRKGHDVTVYAVLGKYDYSEFEKTYGLKVRSLGVMKFATLNSDGENEISFFESLLYKLTRRLFQFPDIELSFKVAKLLRNERKIDLLITVAVPYTIHWGTAYASKWFKQNNINTWAADCGDPFMGNKFTKYPFYFKYLEKWFCRKVDYLTIPTEEARDGYYKEFHDKIRVIPQGFNFEDIYIPDKTSNNSVVTFIYAGGFYKKNRDPRPFLDYLCELNVDFKFVVYTRSSSLIQSYKDILRDKLEIKDYIPRQNLLQVMSQADFLVNFENNSEVQSPSKLIDYALSKRPILSVNSHNINKDVINQFLNRDYTNQLVIHNVEQYNIKNVANKFIELIK